MAAVADGIEFLCQLFNREERYSKTPCRREGLSALIAAVYIMFGFSALVIYTKFSDKDFSAILTAGSGVQCLGFLLLTLKVRGQKSVHGVSSRTLEMYCLVFLVRLCSTTRRNGYIPIDRSGDHMYQLGDALSLLLAVQLLYCIHKTHKSTYQAQYDTLSCMPLVPACVMLAMFVHGNLNRSELYDTIWTTSLNLDTIAMLPQLWMLTRIGGEVEGMTSHFVVAIMVSRMCYLTFWYYGYEEVAEASGGNIAGKQIIIAHLIQLFLSADFLYYYGRGRLSGGKTVLPQAVNEIDA